MSDGGVVGARRRHYCGSDCSAVPDTVVAMTARQQKLNARVQALREDILADLALERDKRVGITFAYRLPTRFKVAPPKLSLITDSILLRIEPDGVKWTENTGLRRIQKGYTQPPWRPL